MSILDRIECPPCEFKFSFDQAIAHFTYGHLACPHCWKAFEVDFPKIQIIGQSRLITYEMYEVLSCKDCLGNVDGNHDGQVCSSCGTEYEPKFWSDEE